MKSRNWHLGLLTLFAVLGALLIVYGSGIHPAQAMEDPDEVPSPIVGVTEGQTARFNLVNVDGPKREPCRGQVQFLDGDGSVVLQRDWELERGKATFVDLGFTQLNRADRRAEIRAMIIYGIGDPNLKKCVKGTLASLEIVDDATSRTMVV